VIPSVTGESILIFDYGSQYAQLIARRVREANVFCQIVRHTIAAERVAELAPKGIILSGGPASVYDTGAPSIDPKILDMGIPVLGICYGMQLACHTLGEEVASAGTREFGRASVRVVKQSPLMEGLPTETVVWMSHGDQVRNTSGDIEILASTPTCPLAAVRYKSRPVYGLQFHPEVSHTPLGLTILRNFLLNICGCHGLWRMDAFIDSTIAAIREQVGDARVICGLSGGVDSSVAAALLLKAIGPQLASRYRVRTYNLSTPDQSNNAVLDVFDYGANGKLPAIIGRIAMGPCDQERIA